ncbi:MAG: polyvinyl alcohol dehydrogenase (cytochrome), partial [Halieaceae bacterium]
NPGLFALNVDEGDFLWRAPLANECREREFCAVGIGAAITATPSLVFAGALDGYLRIYDALNGKVLRKIDTTTPVKTVSGSLASGGSMDGGAAPLPFGGRLYVTSGYNFAGHMKGNVLLVYGKPDETAD